MSTSSSSPDFCYRKRNVAIVLLDNGSMTSSSRQDGSSTPPPAPTTTTTTGGPAGSAEQPTTMVSIELSFGFNPADGSTFTSSSSSSANTNGSPATATDASATSGSSDKGQAKFEIVPAVQFKKTMQRPLDEPLQKTVERIRLNFESKGGGRKKGAKVTREDLLANLPSFEVLDENGVQIDLSLPNSVAWAKAKRLVVGSKKDTVIPVLYNPPTVVSVKPPTSTVLGVPIVPSSIQVQNQPSAEVEGTLCYEWRVRKDEEPYIAKDGEQDGKKTPPPTQEAKKKNKKGGPSDDQSTIEPSDYPESLYEVVSTAPVATLSTAKKDALLGKTLHLRVRSLVMDNSSSSFWVDVVCPRITLSSASADMARWKHTPQRLWDTTSDVSKYNNTSSSPPPPFRMVSYNILHDAFCTSKYAKTVLYPFAQEKFLDMTHRKGRIIQELLSYNTDLIGLQECGKDIYNKYYKSVLASLNYDSVMTTKTGNVTEGVATCFDNRRYELLEHHWYPLSGKYFEKGSYDSRTNGRVFPNGPVKEFATKKPQLKNYNTILPDTPTMVGLLALIQQHPHLEEGLSKVTSVGTATVLKDRFASSDQQKRLLIVTNCHLFWHPNGCHIRSLQCFLHMFAVETLRADLEAQYPEATIATVCCGDYNCGREFRHEFTPGAPGTPTGGYELMRTSICPATNKAWKKGLLFWWGGDEEAELADKNSENGDESSSGAKPEGASNPATTVGAYTKYGAPTICLETDLVLPSARKKKVVEEGDTKEEKSTTTPAPYYYDTHINDPDIQWTNYSPGFKAVIDHIFISNDHLRCTKTVPLPTESEVSAETAIPSSVFPSDHLALVADLEWKK